MNKKKILLGILAGLLVCPPTILNSAHIWDKKSSPDGVYAKAKAATAFIAGGGLLGFIAATAKRKPFFPRIFCGLLFGGAFGAAFFSSREDNSLARWLKEFEAAIDDLAKMPILAPGNFWSEGYNLSGDVQGLQPLLEEALGRVQKLLNVRELLVRRDIFSPLDARHELLDELNNLCSQRLLQISVLVDFKAFHKDYDSFMCSPLVRNDSEQNSWMLSNGKMSSYQQLFVDCGKALALLNGMKTRFSNRLMSPKYSSFLTDEDKVVLSEKMQNAASCEGLVVQRAELSAARWRHQEFNENYLTLTSLGELSASAVVGDAWLNVYFLRTNSSFSLQKLQDHFKVLASSISSELAWGNFLLQDAQAKYLSSDERSAVAAKLLAVQDLCVIFNQRQQILRGLQTVESFNACYVAAMDPAVVRQGSLGADDLSWMQVEAKHRWPLQEVHRLLNVSRRSVADVLRIGSEFLNNQDFRVLSDGVRSDFSAKVSALQQTLALIDARLLVLINSTMYAQEVRAKFEYEELERQRIALERERARLKEIQMREDARIAFELKCKQEDEQRRLQSERASQEREDARIAREQEREQARLKRQQEMQVREDERIAREQEREQAQWKRQQEIKMREDERRLELQRASQEIDDARIAYEQKRQSALLEKERARLKRQQEIQVREDERIARELERIQREQQFLPTAPSLAVPVQKPIVPTAPPMDAHVTPVDVSPAVSSFATPKISQSSLETCFCGDEIPVDKMYKLDCSCKTSFYHADCIKKWVRASKTCPTCRSTMTVADIQRVGAFKPVAPEAPRPAPVKPLVSVPTTQVTTPAPAPVAEAEECYLCLDSDNVADCTTANCDCTVKKAACRACLQDWINRNHTCPNCRKTGATVVSLAAR